jgi:hypothetical protein
MTDVYPVRIFESELRVICDETMDFADIETGGNLFGSLTHGGSPTVWLATRPDGTFQRNQASIELDHVVEYEIEKAVWAQYGIQFLGMWHSHHQLGLYEPSGGDRHRTANYATSAKRRFYVEILCNLPRQPYSRSSPMAVTSNDDTDAHARAREEASVREAGEGHDGQDQDGQSRKKRREQAKEGRRTARGAARGSGLLRAVGPVHVAPFVYVDAPHLDQVDASFEVLPGVSPVRQAIATTDLARAFAEAFRPVDGSSHETIRYELRTSRASRHYGGYAGSAGGHPIHSGQAGNTGLGTTGVMPGDAMDVGSSASTQPESVGTGPVTDAGHMPEDHKPLEQVRGQAIPDMARYIDEFVVPLVQSRSQYVSTVDPEGKDKIVLRVTNKYGSRGLLMVLGWDGQAPVVLSCAVTHGGRAPVRPDPAEVRGVKECFYWGVRQL